MCESRYGQIYRGHHPQLKTQQQIFLLSLQETLFVGSTARQKVRKKLNRINLLEIGSVTARGPNVAGARVGVRGVIVLLDCPPFVIRCVFVAVLTCFPVESTSLGAVAVGLVHQPRDYRSTQSRLFVVLVVFVAILAVDCIEYAPFQLD